MNYYIITETNWAKLRDEILSLAECCHKAFGRAAVYTNRAQVLLQEQGCGSTSSYEVEQT